MRKWMLGVCLIVVGVLVSFGLSSFIIGAEIFMLNPKYKDLLLGSILGIPLLIYGAGYALWYYRCAKQKSRDQNIYKGGWFWMSIIVILEFSVLFFVFEITGLMDEASVHYISSCFISTIFFCVAFLVCKPF